MTGLAIGRFDTRIMGWVADHRTLYGDRLAEKVMYVGTSPAYLVIGVVVALALAMALRAYRPAVAGAVAVVVAALVARELKDLFDRARPPSRLALVAVDPPSFPSSHAAITSALAVAVFVAVSWSTTRIAVGAAAVLLALVVFVGICLVYLGSHWPTDVLAGWMLGGAVGAACGLLARRRPGRVVLSAGSGG